MAFEDKFDSSKITNIVRKRQVISAVWQGVRYSLEDFTACIKNAVDSTELLIRQKDRELFEDILSDTVSRKLTARISESREWITDMSKLMQSMDTSMGLTFSLHDTSLFRLNIIPQTEIKLKVSVKRNTVF